MRSRGLTVALAIGLAACGGPSRGAAYDRAYAEAERAESAGRLLEAVAAYDRAASQARRPRDRERARWSAADVLAHAGRVEDAVARLDAMAADAASDHQAEAALRVALLRIGAGDAARGWRDLAQVPRRFPAHGVAHVAVRRLVEHADAESLRAGLDLLHGLDRDLGASELAPLVAYLTAEHLEQLGDDAAALAAYRGIADRWPYPRGAFFDDALWRASFLDEKAGDVQAAAGDLERLVAVREDHVDHGKLRTHPLRPVDAAPRRALRRAAARPRARGQRTTASTPTTSTPRRATGRSGARPPSGARTATQRPRATGSRRSCTTFRTAASCRAWRTSARRSLAPRGAARRASAARTSRA